jgi:hypothetical protein
VLDWILSNYCAVRAYHGCRPESVDVYYAQGLRTLSRAWAVALARKRFSAQLNPELSTTDVDEAIASVGFHEIEGRVYFCFDDRELLSSCGHYMIYGSEFICGVAARLQRKTGKDYQRSLKAFGVPTILKCDIPITTIARDTLLEIADELIGGLTFLDSGLVTPFPQSLLAFSVKTAVPAQSVVGHWHPKRIRDPIRGDEIYRWDRASRPVKPTSGAQVSHV